MSHWTSLRKPFVAEASGSIPAPTMHYAPIATPVLVEERQQDGRRWYAYQGQLYPSISTVLSATDEEGNRSLKQWRQRVGHTKAATITQAAAARGTRWHKFCEEYVQGRPLHWALIEDPTDHAYAAFIGTTLNAYIQQVVATETRVVSSRYGVAGRLDMAVRLQDGRLAILDFKTGSKQKSGNRLTNYALQATFYADALSEHWSLDTIDTIVIAQLLPEAIIWQESHPAVWRDLLQSRIMQYTTHQTLQLG